jgi:hypothetical protein
VVNAYNGEYYFCGEYISTINIISMVVNINFVVLLCEYISTINMISMVVNINFVVLLCEYLSLGLQ